MSRQRDYQPTIDRARKQAEIATGRESKLRERADRNHRDMLRAQTEARIAVEEADHLREQVVILESIKRDLRNENGKLGMTIGALRAELVDTQRRPWRSAVRRVQGWVRDMMRIGAEA